MYQFLTTPVLERAQFKSRLHSPAPGMSNLYFSKDWPSAHAWARGRYFQITKTVLVPYDKGYIIPGNDVKNLNLSNADDGLKLYPQSSGIVFEILVGMKPGNYQITVFIPGPTNYLLTLDHSGMFPDIADADRRYLAAKTPEDSPYNNPLLKLWAIKDMPSWILKLHAREGVDWEKCVLRFCVAKHRLAEIEQPNVFTEIDYYTALQGAW